MQKEEEGNIIIRPQAGFQMNFASTNVDVAFGVGGVGGGKSYALILAMAEPLMTDEDFRALISRRALGSIKAGGGFVQKFKEIFGKDYIKVRESDNPRVTFPIGTFADLTYIDDTDMEKLRERVKGWEYDCIAIDELTEMSWEAFSYISTRNRGSSKTFTGKFFATLNPKRSHWTRQFLDWYINPDGTVNLNREGRVRYFYIVGDTVKDVIWGNTKEEVYMRCKADIDRKLKAVGGNFSYEHMIKSFVFYFGRLSENKALLNNNANYLGSVAMSGGKTSQALLEVNFNVDPSETTDVPIPNAKARAVTENDPATNGEKWITIDLADVGKDNMTMLAWDGFHIIDMKIICRSTPRENAMYAKSYAEEHDIAYSHIIFDATRGRYFLDYIPDAMPFISNNAPRGIYKLTAQRMKDLCYLRLVSMLQRGHLTMAENVANMTYKHQSLKFSLSVYVEFVEECAVVRFEQSPQGKKALWTKKKMNAMLGHRRSMDVLDPIAMRMLPCVDKEYGSELEVGSTAYEDVTEEGEGDIYDETLWS